MADILTFHLRCREAGLPRTTIPVDRPQNRLTLQEPEMEPLHPLTAIELCLMDCFAALAELKKLREK